jgi:hypothetical protein
MRMQDKERETEGKIGIMEFCGKLRNPGKQL